jgi:transposase
MLLEASTESEWVARHLELLGHEVIVADPNFAPMYATRSRRTKTDKRDARALMDACATGAYRPAHRLADGRRHVRAELAVRDVLVSTRTRCASLAKTFVRRDGLRVPASDSRLVPTKITALALSPALADKLAPLFAVYGPLNEQILGGNSLDSPRTTTKPWDSWRRPLLRTTQLRRGPATRHQLPVNRAAIAAAW